MATVAIVYSSKDAASWANHIESIVKDVSTTDIEGISDVQMFSVSTIWKQWVNCQAFFDNPNCITIIIGTTELLNSIQRHRRKSLKEVTKDPKRVIYFCCPVLLDEIIEIGLDTRLQGIREWTHITDHENTESLVQGIVTCMRSLQEQSLPEVPTTQTPESTEPESTVQEETTSRQAKVKSSFAQELAQKLGTRKNSKKGPQTRIDELPETDENENVTPATAPKAAPRQTPKPAPKSETPEPTAASEPSPNQATPPPPSVIPKRESGKRGLKKDPMPEPQKTHNPIPTEFAPKALKAQARTINFTVMPDVVRCEVSEILQFYHNIAM